jgi:hypothetical protein
MLSKFMSSLPEPQPQQPPAPDLEDSTTVQVGAPELSMYAALQKTPKTHGRPVTLAPKCYCTVR